MDQTRSLSHTRREFLTGKSIRTEAEQVGHGLADAIQETADATSPPVAGSTIRIKTRAMACDFAVLLNPGPGQQVATASNALEQIHALEDQLSVYREESELSHLNRRAAEAPVSVEPQLFRLLVTACQIGRDTDGAFDPTSGPFVDLWRRCRAESRIPNDDEIARTRDRIGIQHVKLDETECTVRFQREGVELNLGGIGKGYALDRTGSQLLNGGLEHWLIHGGHSSVLAHGDHNSLGGWPVGIRNPLFPKQRLATMLLKDCALSTSGSGVQFFRHGGKRYGHILDPRTGWPVDSMLSVTVLAATAAEADALSTAFFVVGVEKTIEYCHNDTRIGVILIRPPHRGRRLAPVVCGVPDEALFFASEE